MPDGTKIVVAEGTPQGGPLSPLLSNIVLDEWDREPERRGHRLVRYADDCNIFVRSARAGERVMASIRTFLERRLRLRVNEEKSGVHVPEAVHFPGVRFQCQHSPDGYETAVLMSAKAEKRLRAKVREMTPPNWGRSLAAGMADLSGYLNGWIAHFRLCTAGAIQALRAIDAHIRRRLGATVICQRKRDRFLFRHLRSRGASVKASAGAALSSRGRWPRSNYPGMTRAYPPAWFTGRLVSLATPLDRTQ
jgi:RNA-directed DNA polymerase